MRETPPSAFYLNPAQYPYCLSRYFQWIEKPSTGYFQGKRYSYLILISVTISIKTLLVHLLHAFFPWYPCLRALRFYSDVMALCWPKKTKYKVITGCVLGEYRDKIKRYWDSSRGRYVSRVTFIKCTVLVKGKKWFYLIAAYSISVDRDIHLDWATFTFCQFLYLLPFCLILLLHLPLVPTLFHSSSAFYFLSRAPVSEPCSRHHFDSNTDQYKRSIQDVNSDWCKSPFRLNDLLCSF